MKSSASQTVLAASGVVLGADADHFVGEQGAEADTVLFFGFGYDGEIGAVLQQESDGVCLKAGNDVQFDLRPHGAEFAHCGHEPVETGVAFDCQPQFACFASMMRARSRSAAETCGRSSRASRNRRSPAGVKRRGVDLRSNRGGVVIVFKARGFGAKGRIGSGRRAWAAGIRCRFFKCQQCFEMAQFDDGIHWFLRFQTPFETGNIKIFHAGM